MRDRTIAVGFFLALVVLGLLATETVVGVILALAIAAVASIYWVFKKNFPARSQGPAED